MSDEKSKDNERIKSMEKEREELRADIRQNNNLMHGMLAALFTGIGAVTAFVIPTYGALLFVVLLTVILIVAAKTSVLLKANTFIATYIIYALEPYLTEKWETHYYTYLNSRSRREKCLASFVMSTALNTYAAVVVCILFWFSLPYNGTANFGFWLVTVIVVLIVLIFCFWMHDIHSLFSKGPVSEHTKITFQKVIDDLYQNEVAIKVISERCVFSSR